MRDPDVAVYPELETVGVDTGAPPGRQAGRKLTRYHPRDADVGYWPEESG